MRRIEIPSLPDETLDDHGDEDALDGDADDGLSGGQLGLERVEAKLGEAVAPLAPVRNRLPLMEALGDGRARRVDPACIYRGRQGRGRRASVRPMDGDCRH